MARRTALLVVDMLNTYDHDDGEALRDAATPVVPRIAALIAAARAAGALVVHVNDTHERPQDVDPVELVTAARGVAGPELIDPVAPAADAEFVGKSRHSAFYDSALEALLEREGISRIVLAGQVTEQCILYTALDAYIRDLELVVPTDAVAAIDPELARAAVAMMARNMSAEITEAAKISWAPEAPPADRRCTPAGPAGPPS